MQSRFIKTLSFFGLGVAAILTLPDPAAARPLTVALVTQCVANFGGCATNAGEECKKVYSEGVNSTTEGRYNDCVEGSVGSCAREAYSCLTAELSLPSNDRSEREPVGPGMSDNVDRAGSDFQSFQMSVRSPGECQGACMRNRNCKAWTYVRPGVQAANPVCYLKNRVPLATKNGCCISGVKPQGTVRDHRGDPIVRDHTDEPVVRDHRN